MKTEELKGKLQEIDGARDQSTFDVQTSVFVNGYRDLSHIAITELEARDKRIEELELTVNSAVRIVDRVTGLGTAEDRER